MSFCLNLIVWGYQSMLNYFGKYFESSMNKIFEHVVGTFSWMASALMMLTLQIWCTINNPRELFKAQSTNLELLSNYQAKLLNSLNFSSIFMSSLAHIKGLSIMTN